MSNDATQHRLSPHMSGAGKRDADRVLQTIKREAVTELVGVLSGFWSAVEEQVRLAALAGHDFSTAQEDRVAMIALGHRALELATCYRETIEEAFEHWSEPRERGRGNKALELMSEDELETWLAGQRIVELLEHQFLHPLAQLEERLEALARGMGVDGPTSNPLHPEVAVTAFVDLFEADDLTPGLRTIVFQQFDRRLPKVLGAVYARANKVLADAEFGSRRGRSRGTAETSRRDAGNGADSQPVAMPQAVGAQQAWVPDGGVVDTQAHPAMAAAGARTGTFASIEVPTGQPMRYRDIVREQLHTWRAHAHAHAHAHGGARTEAPPPEGAEAPATDAGESPDAGVAGRILAADEMFNIASLLQGDDPAPFARALAGEDRRALGDVIRAELLAGVRQLGLDPETTHFTADEEDAIDLVGILFQSLYRANDLLQRARLMYGRLVVPYVKVALTDDSMFNRRSHPARQLLDALTEACDGNAGESPQDRETLERAEHAVGRVVEEYSDDQAIFELAASELRDQLEQQRRRADVAERRATEAIHGRERLQAARHAADELVASRLAGRQLTRPIGQFLDTHWRHYLVQTWLRDGPDSSRHLNAVGVGDAVVQVDADAARMLGAAVADQLLALQIPLGECYACCGLDAGAARDSLAQIISALAKPDSARSEHAPRADVPAGEEEEESGMPLRLAGGIDRLEHDPAIATRMRRLRAGQGLRLIDRHGRETAARIAWISPLTSRFLIVNRRGVRQMVVSPEELAVLVANGRAVVRSVDTPFDEAMKQLWQRLNEAPARPGAAAGSD